MNFFVKLGKGIKEFFRKFLVSLKRRPHLISVFILLIAFLIYSFNLTNITMTTEGCSLSPMGLLSFATFLLSMLSFVCLINAFPKREKVKVAMLVLFFVMSVIIIGCDIGYFIKINQRILSSNINSLYIGAVTKTQSIMIVHIAIQAIGTIALALLPLYAKLIKKINTAKVVDDNGDMAELELDEK